MKKEPGIKRKAPSAAQRCDRANRRSRAAASRSTRLLLLTLTAALLCTPSCFLSGRKSVDLPEIVTERNFVTVQDVRINYLERGKGDRNVVLVHGFGSSIYSWKDILGPLEKHFHVYAMDVKGFGYSEKPKDADYSLVTMIDFVADFMDAVGVEKASLVGNSMGGAFCAATAIDYPEKVERLVLIDAAGYPMKIPFLIRLGTAPVIGSVGKIFYGEWAVRWGLNQAFHDETLVTPERVRAYYLPSKTPNGINAPRKVLRDFNSVLFTYAARRFKRVRCPTLVIWGENDAWIPVENARRFGRDIPNAEVVIIKDCGHAPQEEKPGEVIPALLEFLEAGPSTT